MYIYLYTFILKLNSMYRIKTNNLSLCIKFRKREKQNKKKKLCLTISLFSLMINSIFISFQTNKQNKLINNIRVNTSNNNNNKRRSKSSAFNYFYFLYPYMLFLSYFKSNQDANLFT